MTWDSFMRQMIFCYFNLYPARLYRIKRNFQDRALPLTHTNSSSRVFASCKSAVLKPSVNHP